MELATSIPNLIPLTQELSRRRNANPVDLYLEKLRSNHSKRTQKNALRRILIVLGVEPDQNAIFRFGWHLLRYEHTSAIRSRLTAHYEKPSTINQSLAALRKVLEECWRLELMDAETFHRAKDIQDLKNHTLPRGRVVSLGQQQLLFDILRQDSRLAARRDEAILAVLFGCGLRREEIVKVNLADLRDDYGLKIKGKGYKERMVYLPPDGPVQALEQWLAIRGLDDGPLFPRMLVGNKITPHHLTPQSIWKLCERRGHKAGIGFTPHDTRKTFASTMLSLGIDLLVVQKLLGHSDPNTTATYDLRDEKAKQQAVSALVVPFRTF